MVKKKLFFFKNINMEGDERDENKYEENEKSIDFKCFHIGNSPFFYYSL